MVSDPMILTAYREGANREKLTVKKLIDNEMFFFHRLCPLQTVKKSAPNREKIGTQKATIFSPLVFHRFRLFKLHNLYSHRIFDSFARSSENFCGFFLFEFAWQFCIEKWWGFLVCELFFPLQSPGSPRGGNPRKMGRNYDMLLPGPTPENREKLPEKITKNAPKIHFFVIFR